MVQMHDSIYGGGSDVFDTRESSGDARIVDQRVDWSEFPFGRLKKLQDLIFMGNVGANREGTAARPDDVMSDLSRF